jgi:hypothetical protein
VELRVALALGAQVGVVRETALLNDDDWSAAPNLINLPEDPSVLRAFIGTGTPHLEDGLRATLARSIHETYRLANARRAQRSDPALADWEHLPEVFRESNGQQADHIYARLREIGCTIQAVSGRPVRLIEFSPDEVEQLAQMEHGRWAVERLLGGWKYGLSRDPESKLNPLLVPWDALPDDVKAWNRQAVRAIPASFAGLGLEITRLG